MANSTNGFGGPVIFSNAGVSTSLISGSVISFNLTKTSDVKEITDGNDNFLYVALPKQKKTINVTAVFTNSGSLVTLPAWGTVTTFTNPWSGDVSGSWGYTKGNVASKSDDVVTVQFEASQWVTTSGTLP